LARRAVVVSSFVALLLGVTGCASTSSRARAAATPASPVWLVPPAGPAAFTNPGAGLEGTADLGNTFGLADVIQYAAAHNPRLSTARHEWLAARERPTLAGALPDPMLTYAEMLSPIETRIGPVERSVMLTQRIPLPAKLRSASRIASEKARISELGYHIALRDVLADVKVSYAELLYLRKAIRIVEQNQAIAKQLAEKSAALYAGDEGKRPDQVTLFDTNKAQAQVAQLTYSLITLQELARTEEARLNGLLSRGPAAPIGTPRDLLFRPLAASQGDLYKVALERSQELKSAMRKISAADEALRLAELSQLPDFTVGVQHTFVGRRPIALADNGDNATALTFGVTLPIWAQKNRARIAEAEFMRQAARTQRQGAVDQLMTRITRSFFRLQNAERLARLYGESLVPQAARALEIAQEWRDTGRDTFGRLLEAQGVWLNFQLAHQRALADYEQEVARMEKIVGISLGYLRKEG